MNQAELEIGIVIIALFNFLLTIYFLGIAHKRGKLKKGILGAVSGMGAAVVLVFSGMTVSLLAQFFITYPVEVALGGVFALATCAVPLCTWLAQRGNDTF